MEISIESIVKKYGDRNILDINSMILNKGKLYGIFGPNGAGKSTLLKIIAGLDENFTGKILYDEKPLNQKVLKNVTYLTQKPYLFRTSVFNNIAYPLKIRKYPKNIINTKVNNIIDELQLNDFKNQLATHLSGGESQKVALARALVFEPDLLLLDEPTANIDLESIKIIESTILKRKKESEMTTVIITHSYAQAKRICDDIIFIYKGKLQKTATFLF